MLNKNRLLDNFLKLLSINSPSKNERQIADYLIKYLSSLGLEVNEDQAGKCIGGNCGNLYFKIPATNPEYTPIAFFAHLDTVKATVGIKIKVTDNWIITDGNTILGADDKAGIAIILELVHFLKEQSADHGEIELIFTVAEESGLEGVKNFDINMLEAKLGFVLDSGDNVGSFVVKAPAEYDTTIEVFGKPAHAGVEPEKGLNAIFLTAQALLVLPIGRIDEETTFNIGIISGGESTNIVPDYVRLQGELRSLNEEKADFWIKEIKNIFEIKIQQLGGKSQLKYNKIYSSFDISQNENFKKLISQAAQKIGVCPRGVSRGGGSDANILNEKGLPSTNLGLGMKEEHTYKEKIAINNLVKAGELVLAIVQSLPRLTDE